MPTRVATLSQHLFYEPPNPSGFWSRPAGIHEWICEIAKAVAGILIPKRQKLEARSTSTGCLLRAN
jgi:hypothetical protein